MRKALGISAALAVMGFMALGTGLAAANATPRWVKHVRSYPGGISGGVRAYLDPGTAGANPGLTATRAPARSRARRAPRRSTT